MITPVERYRDVIVYFKGATLPVEIDPSLISSGWKGGTGVSFVEGSLDRWTVEQSDGSFGGFLLWGSDESADQFTSMTGNQIKYTFGVLCLGGWLISTSTYETHTYASRTGPGPLVPLNYNPSDLLYFSLRGYWTVEDERTLSGNPNPARISGVVAAPPKPSTNFFLGIQTVL